LSKQVADTLKDLSKDPLKNTEKTTKNLKDIFKKKWSSFCRRSNLIDKPKAPNRRTLSPGSHAGRARLRRAL